jgi:TIR domain
MPANVFISYPRSLSQWSDQLAKCLELNGFHCLMVNKDIEIEQNWQEWQGQIQSKLKSADICLIVLSRASDPSTEGRLSREWQEIQICSWDRKDLSLCCMILGKEVVPSFLRPWKRIELSEWGDENWDDIVSKTTKLLMDAHSDITLATPPKDLLTETSERFEEMKRTITSTSKSYK